MAGTNTSGLANTADYNLGRGKLFFGTINTTTGFPLEYRDLGNATEFNLSVETETVEHQSSRAGLKVTDKEVLVSQKVSLSLTLDEINFENMALFFSGTSTTHTNPATANIAAKDIVAAGGAVTKGRWYDLYDKDIGVAGRERLYDTDGTFVFNIAISGAGTPLVEGTDYTLDKKMGRVFIIESTILSMADGLEYIYTATTTELASIDEMRALTQTSVAGALKFISENPADADQQTEYQFHQVSLKAEGDFGLISDEFTAMQLTGVAEKNTLVDLASPTLTIRTHGDARTV